MRHCRIASKSAGGEIDSHERGGPMHKRKCATSWLMAKLDHRFPTHQRRTWLAADVGQFPAGAALDEQRHEVSEGSAVEPRVIVVDNRRDGVRRNVWIALLEAIHHVLNSRP